MSRDGNALAHCLAKTVEISDQEVLIDSYSQAAECVVFMDNIVTS